jgi:hypothetical protein
MSYRGRCPNPSDGVRKREGIGAKTKDATLASSSGNWVKTRTAVNTWTYYKADVFIYSARYLPIGLASTRFSLAEFTLHTYGRIISRRRAAVAFSQTAYKRYAVTCSGRIPNCMHAAAIALLQWQDTKLHARGGCCHYQTATCSDRILNCFI